MRGLKSKVKVTGNEKVKIVFAHIFVKSGSMIYGKWRPKWSADHSTYIAEYISPAKMFKCFISWYLSVCLSHTSHTFRSSNIETWQKVYIFRGSYPLGYSQWWCNSKIKKSKLKVTGNKNVWINLRQAVVARTSYCPTAQRNRPRAQIRRQRVTIRLYWEFTREGANVSAGRYMVHGDAVLRTVGTEYVLGAGRRTQLYDVATDGDRRDECRTRVR